MIWQEIAIGGRITIFAVLLVVAWFAMTLTHEIGHIVGGWCCGATLEKYSLFPLPYSFFRPDPRPLVTTWSGPLIGATFPLAVAALIRRDECWFIAYFCLLANGVYLAVAWVTGDSQLDTAKLIQHGAHPVTIVLYCVLTIGFGYTGFRR